MINPRTIEELKDELKRVTAQRDKLDSSMMSLMCHHRIVDAMMGKSSTILVTDTLLQRLAEAKHSIVKGGTK